MLDEIKQISARGRSNEQEQIAENVQHEWEEYANEEDVQVYTREEKDGGESAGINSIIIRSEFPKTSTLALAACISTVEMWPEWLPGLTSSKDAYILSEFRRVI